MKIKIALVAALLAAAAVAPLRADGIPAWRMEKQLTMGFALGIGEVANEDGEIFAGQLRVEYRKKRTFFALRSSWVATWCNSSSNPTELSLLAGASLPLGSERNRLNFGIGLGLTSPGGLGLPLETRLKIGAFSLTAFANLNRPHGFMGLCLGFDFPLRIFSD